jgi:hypothetical protein
MTTKNFTYKSIAKYNITSLKTAISNEAPTNWQIYDFRQKLHATHTNTQTIPLLWLSNYWEPSKTTPITIHRFTEFNHYAYYIKELHKNIQQQYPNTTIVKAMLAKLQPFSKIDAHIDQGNALQLVNRCHLVIKTNPQIKFVINGITHYFKEGEFVEINNTLTHEVINDSPYERIHLIVDLLDNVLIKNREIVYKSITTDNKDDIQL